MDPVNFKKDRLAPRIPIVDGLREAIEATEPAAAVRIAPAGVATTSSSEVEIIPGKKRRAEQVDEPISKQHRPAKRPRRAFDFLPTD